MMISVIVFLLLSFQDVKAQSSALVPSVCGTATPGWTGQILLKMTESTEHPFANECVPFDFMEGKYLSANSNKERVKALDFRVYPGFPLPSKTEGGKSVKDFFKDIRNSIRLKIQEERKKVLDAQSCLKTKTPNECLKVNEQAKASVGIDDKTPYNFNDLVADARFNLALSHPPSPLSRINKSVDIPNWTMSANGVHKERWWAGLTKEENNDVYQVFGEYQKEAGKCARSISEARKKYDSEMRLLTQMKAEGREPKTKEEKEIQLRIGRIYAEYRDKLKAEEESRKAREQAVKEGHAVPATFSRVMGKIGYEVSDIFITDEGHMGIPNGNNYKIGALYQDCLAEKRYEHMAAYTTLLVSHPILQFIKNLEPSKEEVNKAVEDMLKSLDKEEKWIEEITASIDSTDQPHKDLLKLLNYKTEVSKTLSAFPEYCGLSRDLVNLAEAKSLGIDMALTLPILMASFFMPVTAVILVDTASIGAMAVHDHVKYRRAAYQVNGRFDPADEVALQDASMKLTMRDMDLFFTAFAASPLLSSYNRAYIKNKLRFGEKVVDPYIKGEYTVVSRRRKTTPRVSPPPPRRISTEVNP